MHKFILALACASLATSVAISQEYSRKFGKVTDYELKMNQYDKDTTAEAVVLYDLGYTSYDLNTSQGFRVSTEISQKIKILKAEGLDRANITLPYYYASNGTRESITGLEAFSFNLENGKLIKTKLEKKYIFDEEINKYYRQLKFSIPNVKPGTVIEYKYTRNSDRETSLPNWQMQASIPVKFSCYEAVIPEYFIFNNETRGYEPIKVEESRDNKQFNLGSNANGATILDCTCRRVKFTSENLPALKDEPHVWCKNDYRTEIRFELNGTKFPNQLYKPYMQTWENLEETIRKETDFGSNMKMSNPFKTEIKSLTDTITNERNKIEAIFSFIKRKIKWNESYSFDGERAKEAIKNRTGNNGQINMILLSALKDAGIKAYPILISRRSQGRIPYTYPSYDQLSTFVVAARTKDDQVYYMDGSAVFGGLNVLPVDLLVDRGRVLENSETEKWVDLTQIAKNQSVYFISANLSKDGLLNGTLKTRFDNQFAYGYKSRIFNAKDSADFTEKLENDYKMKIKSITLNGKDSMSNSINEDIAFSKEINLQGEFLYLNPMLLTHISKNPFTQSERKLPIEFDYPHSVQMVTQLEIPDNYQVEELPKSVQITLPENAGKCIYQISKNENMIQLSYKFALNRTIFTQDEYTMTRDFYAQIATKNSEMIVLKKIK